MGCDIDVLFEIKNPGEDWKPYEDLPEQLYPDERNYEPWGFLFGVRSHEYDPLFENRGWPEDNAHKQWEEKWDGDPYNTPTWHNFSYMTLDEAKNIKWPEELKGSYFYIFCEYIWPRLKGFSKNEFRMLVRFNS